MRTPFLFLLSFLGVSVAAAQTTPESYNLLADVRYLASDALAGRITGSAGADSAAEYIARRFQAVGLQPSSQGWFQAFTVSKDAPAVAQLHLGELSGRNVIGVLPGRDPVLRNEIIVVGAHYDHLGMGGSGSGALDPDVKNQVHNGADDNASGTAALIHIANRLAQQPPARTVVFIAFSGEELGLLGSAYYVKHPLYPLPSTEAMVNMDMVGRLRNKRLIVYGIETAKEFPALLDSLNWYAGFDLKKSGDGYGPSDQQSFFVAKRPVLHIFTDLHEDYHRASDDWDKINADGLVRVADFTASIVRALADRNAALTFVDAAPPDPHTGAVVTGGYGAYLGTVPDMSENPGGVRISGVRAGSPAEKVGLTGGDILVRIGEKTIEDLQGMTDALRSHKAGDVVEIEFVWDGTHKTASVTLGTRPS
jgi:Peptidase family M28/PDZ domain